MESKNTNLDEELVKKLYLDIRAVEGRNVKTGQYDDKTMVKMIANTIYRAVKESEEGMVDEV